MVYFQDHQLSSTALRPYIVYGVGRDQGMTSEPTKAMLAAAAGKCHLTSPLVAQHNINWPRMSLLQFIEMADNPLEGANAFNLGNPPVSMEQVVEAIKAAVPGADITFNPQGIPFPVGFDDSELRRVSKVYETPLAEGIQQTIDHFRACLEDGRLSV